MVLKDEQETGGLPNAVVNALIRAVSAPSYELCGGTWIELVHDRFVYPIRASNQAWLAAHQNPVSLAAQIWAEAGAPIDVVWWFALQPRRRSCGHIRPT